MASWAEERVFYHIYPLGLCGAPERNDFMAEPQPRILELEAWLPHIRELGCDALYIGPHFESAAHGYDTVDYFKLDRRLGRNQDLARFCQGARDQGMKIVFDAVFNHVGVEHPFFRDLAQRRQDSPYRDWFVKVDFSDAARGAPGGQGFGYEGWGGHYNLAKLNLENPAVKAHLFAAVASWMDEYGIDGLRLDAADCLDKGFLRELSAFCRSKRADFWLMAELIHGNYSAWLKEGGLDSATNYECWKGLYSSMNDDNLFEIAHSLTRLFGEGGLYRGLNLYSFADNHDVDRVASLLKKRERLFPLYFLLYAMPGSPSLYYGSEWGLEGKKRGGSDAPLRPRLSLDSLRAGGPEPGLKDCLTRLAAMRRALPELRHGAYRQAHVSSSCLAFFRETAEGRVLVAVNASDKEEELVLDGFSPTGAYADPLNGNEGISSHGGRLRLRLFPNWGRVIRAA